jgi:hypothetical protein
VNARLLGPGAVVRLLFAGRLTELSSAALA